MGNAEACMGSANVEDVNQFALPAAQKMTDSELVESLEKIKADALKSWSENTTQRMQRYKGYLDISLDQMEAFREDFIDELNRGLLAHKSHPRDWVAEECSFKMLDSYCNKLPTGNETGVFYSLDFGGTNLRSVRCELFGDGRIEAEQYKVPLQSAEVPEPKGLLDPRATATQMFDFFAKSTKFFMKKKNDMDRGNIPVGFTFSFPATQRRIDSAELIVWTKGFETGRQTRDPVEGQDVGALLNHAFTRHGVPASTAAVANDTVGTLLSGAYEKDSATPDCRIGLIIGTGFNACYVEEKAAEFDYIGSIVNIESGNFNRTSLPRTNIDLEIDFSSIDNRGHQQLEKMVAGAYLGECARRVILKVLQELAPVKAWEPGTLTAEDAANIMLDTSTNCAVTRKFLKDKWDCPSPSEEVVKIVREVSELVYERSACLVAVMIAAIAEKTGYLQPARGGLSVAVDGSLYLHNHLYREKMREFLDKLLGKETAELIHFVTADDGSGKGAAVFAAL